MRRHVDIHIHVEGMAAQRAISVAGVAHRLTVSRGRVYGRIRIEFPHPFETVQLIDGMTLSEAEFQRVQSVIAHLLADEAKHDAVATRH